MGNSFYSAEGSEQRDRKNIAKSKIFIFFNFLSALGIELRRMEVGSGDRYEKYAVFYMHGNLIMETMLLCSKIN